MSRSTLLDLGIMPAAAGGTNVNPQVRKAVIAKLSGVGIAVNMKTPVVELCQHVCAITGDEMPDAMGSNGLLAKWVMGDRVLPPATSWKRSAYRFSREMCLARERARAAQPPMMAMTGNAPWRSFSGQD